ncbi:hypothetical protein [Paenibacillus sp. MBLB4367]|uniref:hypothetical protein n=1 Tax=Paenibacillus sp. MBLB4367 TaxID=3384767 RepID=UPI003908029A
MTRSKRHHGAAAGDNKEEGSGLPPRSVSHPAESGKWTKIFYRTLLALFMLLIASLIGWFLWENRET